MLVAGCIDFVEPELPERGAPAVAEISVLVSDSGDLAVSGAMTPGFASDGLRRVVTNGSVRAGTYSIPPVDTLGNGGLRYGSSQVVDATFMRGDVLVRAPAVSRTDGTPIVLWPGLARLDPDTIFLRADGSLVLRAATSGPIVDLFMSPPPDTRQWFLTLSGNTGVFRLGSDGEPPDSLVIPPHWVPASDGRVDARLIFQQSGIVRVAQTYLALISLDLRVHWTVLPAEPSP